METALEFAVVLVTVPDLKTARTLVGLALQNRLVACGNIIPGLESHYWWEGKIDISTEALVLFKTTVTALDPLEQLILSNHPYDTPEIITLPLNQGTARYLAWIKDSLTGPSQ